SVGGFNWNVTGSQFNTGGNLPHDDSSQTAFSGRIGYDFPWRGELSLTGRDSYLDLELPIFSTPPPLFHPTPTTHPPTTPSKPTNQLEPGLSKLGYTKKIPDWWNVSASFGQWFNNSHFRDTPPPGDTTTISQINTSRLQADLLSTFTIPKWNTLTLGWEYRSESGTGSTTGTVPAGFSRTPDTA